MASALECIIENTLRDETRKYGGIAYKLSILGKRNFPDRTIFLPHGYIVFAECKRSDTGLRKTQSWFANKILRPLGFTVYVVRGPQDVAAIFLDYKSFLKRNNLPCKKP